MRHCAVIGGGITGLAAALRLREAAPDIRVTLIEADERLGGKILTERMEGLVVEGAPDCFLSRKPRGIGLCKELGIADRLIGRRPEHAQTFVRFEGRLHRLPEGLSGFVPTDLGGLAATTLLTDEAKARIAREPDVPAFAGEDDESIAEFMTRRLGAEAYERLVEPLLSGIYGGNGADLSLDATFPALREIEREHGSLLRGLGAQADARDADAEVEFPPFVSFPDGMVELVDAIERRLGNVDILLGRAVTSIRRHSTTTPFALDVTDPPSGTSAEAIECDAVILTTPAAVTGRFLKSFDTELGRLHEEIPYGSCATISLALRAGDIATPPRGYGYLVPRIEDADVLACTVSSNKWDGRAPEDRLLVRVYVGRVGGNDVLTRSDEELTSMATDEIRRTLGIDAEPELVRIYRWPSSMPQYTIGHRQRVARIEAVLSLHPGLFVAGAAYEGVGIPDCIASGERAAERCADLATRPAPKTARVPNEEGS